MQPLFKIATKTKDITDSIRKNLQSLTLVDKKNLEADQLTLALTDPEFKLQIPPVDSQLEISLGFEGDGLIHKGNYTVETVDITGPPEKITIRATSANLTGDLKAEKDQSWDGLTLGEILESLAATHNLTPAIATDLASIAIDHIDQTSESDANFITRLAETYDALANIKQDHLIFTPLGRPTTISGKALPVVTFNLSDISNYSWGRSNRKSSYTGAQAFWHDAEAAQRRIEIAGAEGTLKSINGLQPSQREAITAATSKWQEIQRGTYSINLTLPIGRPDIFPNMGAWLTGFRDEITTEGWIIEEVTHKLTTSGLTTDVKLEKIL